MFTARAACATHFSLHFGGLTLISIGQVGNHDIHATELDGTLFVSGGLAFAGFPVQYRVFDELLGYTAATGSWRVVSRLPERRTYNGLAAMAGEVWVCGGADGSHGHAGEPGDRVPSSRCFAYSVATDCWRECSSMSVARIECTTLFVNGRLYTFGGASASEAGTSIDVVESIGPGESSWRIEELAMPTPLRQFSGCVLNGKVYLCGGCEQHGGAPNERDFLEFDPTGGGKGGGSWRSARSSGGDGLPAHPAPPQAPFVAAHDGAVWVVAGNPPRQDGPKDNGLVCPAAAWRYIPGDERWEQGPAFPTQQAWGASYSFEGQLVCMSGAHGVHSGTTVFDPRCFGLG